jgi:hypothetical protein
MESDICRMVAFSPLAVNWLIGDAALVKTKPSAF